jgi:hypothetical protein
VAYFKILSQHSSVGNEENHKETCCQVSQCPIQEKNQVILKYRSDILPLEVTSLATVNWN